MAKDQEVRLLLETVARNNQIDLESIEQALRTAVLAAGASILSELLAGIGSGRQQQPVLCTCGTTMVSLGRKSKPLLTILGEVEFTRSLFQCPQCAATRFPGDELLDVVGTSRSPSLRRMMARAGSRSTFKEAQQDLAVYAGINVSAKDVERVAEATGEAMELWDAHERSVLLEQHPEHPPGKPSPLFYIAMDGTGIPMVLPELKGRKGKQPDGSAKTREVKLGCVFTQTSTDEEGRPVRDPDSTSFTGAIETAEVFGRRIYAEAVRRGLLHAEKVVVLGDGAEWIRNLVELHFPQATQIIDLYHAREHLVALCKLLRASDSSSERATRRRLWKLLDRGLIETITAKAATLLPEDQNARADAMREIAYLERNKARMRYAAFRSQGLFVGSGVIEAGCKTVVGKRLKQSGMEWSLRGANAILSLRCMFISGRTEEFWSQRAA